MIKLFGLERQETHQMKDTGMAGFDCKGLPAAELRFEILFRPQMTKAGFIECGGGACAGTERFGLGRARGCPLVATIHLLISTWILFLNL
jgi:hypothetical protein